MPYTILKADDTATEYDDTTAWKKSPKGIGLRQTYSSSPTLASSTEVVFREWSAEMLDTLWAIEPIVLNLPDATKLYSATAQDYGKVEVRISVDSGVTWLYWNGSAWAAATTEWSTFGELNTNLGSIPFVSYKLMIAVKITKGSSEDFGPILRGVRLGYKVIDGLDLDEAPRSLKRCLETRLALPFRELYKGDGTSSPSFPFLTDLKSISAVYNVTDDPTRTTNIYDDAFSGKEISLTTSPGSDKTLEITGTLSIPVRFWKPDPNFINELDKHAPCILIQFSRAVEHDMIGVDGLARITTKNFSTQTYWKESQPLYVDMRFYVRCLAASESMASRMSSAAYHTLRTLSETDYVPFVYTGSFGEIVSFTPPFDDQSEPTEGLSLKSFSAILCARKWSIATVEEGPYFTDYEVLTTLLE